MTMLGRDLQNWLDKMHWTRKDLANALELCGGTAIEYYLSGRGSNRPLNMTLRLALAALQRGIKPVGGK